MTSCQLVLPTLCDSQECDPKLRDILVVVKQLFGMRVTMHHVFPFTPPVQQTQLRVKITEPKTKKTFLTRFHLQKTNPPWLSAIVYSEISGDPSLKKTNEIARTILAVTVVLYTVSKPGVEIETLFWYKLIQNDVELTD